MAYPSEAQRSSLYGALIRGVPYDPDRMSDPDYWFDHAEQDRAEAEARSLEEAFAQIKAGDVQ